jgi:O-antigen/teichoic acid export membrane protein
VGERYLMTEIDSKERTRNYLSQIKGSFVYRAVAMGASFVVIPLMIRYLGYEQYGVWATLLSIMSWVVFFDLGIGNGLRNKVAESLAGGEQSKANDYISSGYTLIGLIALALWIVVSVCSYFISWQTVFNTQVISESTLGDTVRIISFFILLNFWVGLINALFGAIQKNSLIAVGQLVMNLLVLTLVFILSKTTEESISYLALTYGISLVSPNILLSLWFYRSRPKLCPRLHIDLQHMRPLLTLGLQFFAIQLAVLVIFTTDKMLITQLIGPQYVTQYEVVFKLFSLITFLHGLISMPLWSAYTEAYRREDFAWIRKMFKKQLLIFVYIAIVVFLLAFLARPIIEIWIGKNFIVSYRLIAVMGMFILISCWNNIYAMLVNGIGDIKLRLFTSLFAMLLNIPLSFYLVKYMGLGISGIVLGTICSLMIAAVALPIQVYRLLRTTIIA